MKALIIRAGALGDTLMLLPALVELWGKVTITYVGRQPGLGFIEPYVHYAIDLEGPGWHRLFGERPDPYGLPVSRADLVVAFFADQDGTIRKNLKRYLPGIPVSLFPSFPSEDEPVHVARYLTGCLRSANLPVDPDRSIKTILTQGLPRKMVLPSCQNKIIFHPGSGDPGKNHPPDLWLDLIGRIGKEFARRGSKPVILLGPAEESIYPFFEKAASSLQAEIRYCPDKCGLTRILGEAILYLGQDSGITHLAAMLGTPTIALFKKTSVTQWRPLGPYVNVILQKEAGPDLVKKAIEAAMSFYRLQGADH